MGAKIESIGIYLPKNVIDNTFFEKTLDTSDEWIKPGLESNSVFCRCPWIYQ